MNAWNFEYSLELDEPHGVIYQKIYGIWREATAKAFHEDFMEEVKPIIHKPWVKMADLTGWKTASPDVIDLVGIHQAWCLKHNMVGAIYVIENPVTYGQLMRMFAKGGTKDVSKTVRSRAEAYKELIKLGFEPQDAPSQPF